MSESCNFHSWQLVAKKIEADARPARPLIGLPAEKATRTFRCTVCGQQAEILVSRRHEIQWKTKPKPGPLEDQLTIYDDAKAE